MNVSEHVTELIIGAIVAIFGTATLIKYSVSKSKNSNNSTTVNQNNNKVTNGDIVGGDKSVR
jgi:hypothetical protein